MAVSYLRVRNFQISIFFMLILFSRKYGRTVDLLMAAESDDSESSGAVFMLSGVPGVSLWFGRAFSLKGIFIYFLIPIFFEIEKVDFFLS